ncbi:MFS transporter [Paenibacillus chitinolyticus]|uniref:MFS transporter n=1 Tax=Paenibacillus chitinolyticus TaxID=79263 RepID=UPI002DBC5465|nr:MFS transporter [Paenibacillus chitinolyticus]MEC0245601.1 MFS transporter [Paenibacillus chitinolyticus]
MKRGGFLLWPAKYLLVFLLFGLGIGFTLPGYITAAALAVTEEEQPSVAAFTASVQGVGSFAGPLTGTLLYSLHTSAPYAICALLTAVFALTVRALPRPGTFRQAASAPSGRTPYKFALRQPVPLFPSLPPPAVRNAAAGYGTIT